MKETQIRPFYKIDYTMKETELLIDCRD